VDLRHLPEGTHPLAPGPGPLVRLTFQIGLPGRSPTGRRPIRVAGLAPALSKVWTSRLFIGLRGRSWCRV